MRKPFLLMLMLTAGLLAAGPRPAHPAGLEGGCPYPDALDDLLALKVIYRPLPTLPALVRPGDTLTVWAQAPSGAAGWAASLRFGALDVPLAGAGGGYSLDMGLWVLGFTVPAGTAEELYDLVLTSGTTTDTTHHSVKVLPGFRRDYYFAQVTDTHFPSNRYSFLPGWSGCDTSAAADFDAVIGDLNIIHPEFVLHTGDLVNEGNLQQLFGAHEFARVKQLLGRFRDPLFLVAGNHDVGGVPFAQVPAGTARREWWRFFGWPFLADPPAGYGCRSQVYSFDYGPLHLAGLEAYVNYEAVWEGAYGGHSFTRGELDWLRRDLAATGARHKLLFYHFDFRDQIDLDSLGVDGAVYGHQHGLAEGRRTVPFNLELGAVSEGTRAYRVFRVHDGVVSPTLMQRADGSLSSTWSGPNDGTATRLSVLVTNGSAETWEHARLVFHMADRDSGYRSDCGSVAQVIREGGVSHVYVDCVLPGGGLCTAVSVHPAGDGPSDPCPLPFASPRLDPPAPNPHRPGREPLTLRFALPAAGPVHLALYDVAGRRVATLVEGRREAGTHAVRWDGRSGDGRPVPPGLYVARLEAAGTARSARVVVVR